MESAKAVELSSQRVVQIGHVSGRGRLRDYLDEHGLGEDRARESIAVNFSPAASGLRALQDYLQVALKNRFPKRGHSKKSSTRRPRASVIAGGTRASTGTHSLATAKECVFGYQQPAMQPLRFVVGTRRCASRGVSRSRAHFPVPRATRSRHSTLPSCRP
jgi:hypothetical protein